ncbi:MAG: hypothetical protein Q8L14_21830 [Myxococcales bacterium]|nr:hypothetical protein [Myxococcales bacterium]
MRRLLLFSLLLSAAAWADRGALTVDVAGGGVAAAVPALHSETPKSTLSFDASIWLGGRYALGNNFEVTASGFFEPPATVFQNDVRLVAGSGVYPGTTRHQFLRFGAQAGVRLVLGMRFRFHLGVEAGWCQQAYSKLQHFDVSNPEAAVDYGLSLPDESHANLVVSPLIGVEWAAGDSWSLALLPRAQLMLGNGFSWAVIVPLQFSWSWYL